ncbi:MAG: response regulator [Nitrospiraceae bacterium]|nr:response regulator [Nitrospiraceae bacterium]
MRKRRALIFDDDANVLVVLADFLASRGYDVIVHQQPKPCMHGPGGGICRASQACADVLVTDFQMPGMNGIQLLQEQQRMRCKIPSANKAIMSGWISDERLQMMKPAGLVLFEKPFDFSKMESWLDNREVHMDLSKPLSSLFAVALATLHGV